MREIKFRGLDVQGNWYYGFITHYTGKQKPPEPDGWYISNAVGMPFAYQIRPETVGQFTGLTDKNGVEIYEGDIVEYFFNPFATPKWSDAEDEKHKRALSIVEHGDKGNLLFKFIGNLPDSYTHKTTWAYWHFSKCAVIGNIHQNPELLK